jgi:phosphoribosylamine--glycine ligase
MIFEYILILNKEDSVSEVEKLLVVGSGGREFSLLEEALRASVKHVYSTRGEDAVNLGIEGVINTGLGDKDIAGIGAFASQEEIDLVVVGPEAPLIAGVADVLRDNGAAVYGPGANGAKFEDDKRETHDFIERHNLPNPDNSRTFGPSERDAAKDFIRSLGPDKVYTKRVGQEGGKGAVGYGEDELDAALQEVDIVADKGEGLLVQGRLLGPEYSGTFMLDGQGNVVSTALARDHKSLFNGGQGPNTGGMGAFAPLTREQATIGRRQEIERIGLQIAGGLVEDGIGFQGTLYAGLMAETSDPNSPLRILEFNVRFGDPETQVLLRSLGGRAIQYMLEAAHGAGEMDMSRLYLSADEEPVTLTVCLASPGYSQESKKVLTGLPVHVPDNLPEDISVQFAGAKMVDGQIVSSGGRVLYVTKTAINIEEARGVYNYIGREKDGVYIGDDQQLIRSDIGLV